MKRTSRIVAVLIAGAGPLAALADEGGPVSSRYKALKCPQPSLGATWTVLDRDGANRKVTPYLSSLGQGEAGTGVISSPPFPVGVKTIGFTLCGHDGPAGGRGENYLCLVDARKGNTLLKTAAPQNDAMQAREWDVSGLAGTEVRIEAHDGNAGGGFAWMGVGRIDAGEALRVDFAKGMPKGWAQAARKEESRYETIAGGIPFKRTDAFTIIPAAGSVEIPCGFAATRLFFLGATTNGFRPLETFAGIEIHYRAGSPDVFPLMCGFTLDGTYKLRSPSKATHLHGSGDPYQHYLVIAPRPDAIEKIRLVAQPDRFPVPRITAITCETQASSEHLMPLPDSAPDGAEAAWIDGHGLRAGAFDLAAIAREIREAHRVPAEAASPIRFERHTIDQAFRSEGVAVADLDGDGHLDIAAGNVYYAGPDWHMVATQGEPREFNRLGYSDAFLCFADDLNGDGRLDLIEVGFPGQQTYWLENPGKAAAVWKKHLAIERTGNETPAYADVDGDGRRELVFMNDGRCSLARPGPDPTRPWALQPLAAQGEPAPGHGLGVGDINKDGRPDIVCPDGWWEGPPVAGAATWTFHPAAFFGGAQLCVTDVDGDGDNDVLGSSPHAYGIAWTEQAAGGWVKHDIEDAYSQTHALRVADLNGDGLVDFVTGKRFWAHNGHDPGSFQPSFLCWYEQSRVNGAPAFTRHTMDFDSGVGLQFEIVDLDGDKLADIVTANKKGVCWFRQVREGPGR